MFSSALYGHSSVWQLRGVTVVVMAIGMLFQDGDKGVSHISLEGLVKLADYGGYRQVSGVFLADLQF